MGEDDYSWLMDMFNNSGDTAPVEIPDNPGGTFANIPEGPSIVNNGDGTWTDTSTGIKYDANGISLGNDPTYTDALNQGDSTSGWQNLLGGGGAGGLLSTLMPLLSVLGPLAGGIVGYNKTNQATDQMTQAVKDANTAIANTLGGATSLYNPYVQAGSGALNKAASMQWTPLSSMFKPLGSGRALSSYLGR